MFQQNIWAAKAPPPLNSTHISQKEIHKKKEKQKEANQEKVTNKINF